MRMVTPGRVDARAICRRAGRHVRRVAFTVAKIMMRRVPGMGIIVARKVTQGHVGFGHLHGATGDVVGEGNVIE